MIGACRQIELTHRRPHQALTFRLELAKLSYLADAHIGVAEDVGVGRLGVGKSVVLNISGGLHALADGLAGFAKFIPAEFFVIDSGHFDVDVDAVEQWTGDSFLVFGNDSGGTCAGLDGVSCVPTWAGVYTIEVYNRKIKITPFQKR